MSIRNLLPLSIAALLGFALGLVEAMERLSYAETLSWAEAGLAASLGVGLLGSIGVRARPLARFGVCLLRTGLTGGVFSFVFEGMRLLDKLGKPGLALAAWAFAGILALLLARLAPAGPGGRGPRQERQEPQPKRAPRRLIGRWHQHGRARPASAARLVALLTAAGTAAACGTTTASANHNGHQVFRRTQRSGAVSLPDRLFSSPAFSGSHGLSAPNVVRNPHVWVNDIGKLPYPARQARRLTRLGFVAGTYEKRVPAERSLREGISLIEQFRTAPGARAELAGFRADPAPGRIFHRFAVSGIPHAVGVETNGPFLRTRTIAFVSGAFYYQTRVTVPRATGNLPSRDWLIRACRAWYHHA